MSEYTWQDLIFEFGQEAVRLGADRFDVLTLLMTEPDTYGHQMARQRLVLAVEERRRRAEESGEPLPTSEKVDAFRAFFDRFVAAMQPFVRAVEAMNQPSHERCAPPVKPALRYIRPKVRRGQSA